MRALKTILIIVGAVLGIGAIMYAMGDPDYRVERGVVINAPTTSVFGHVGTLAAMDKWSPWNEKDPNMKKSMEGTDGTVGAKATWEGNSDVGKGSQEIAAIVPGERVALKLAFVEPFASNCDVEVGLAPEGAACYAALKTLLAAGTVQPEESVVLFNTSTGLKYLECYGG